MNVFAFALEREQEREAYYNDLAVKAEDPGFQQIFSLLAKQEAKHVTAVKRLLSENHMELGYESFLLDAKGLARELNLRRDEVELDGSEVKALEKARDFENESIKLYSDALGAAETPEPARQALKRLLREEQLHFDILDSLVEFVSRPAEGHWLENAEWYHQEDY